MRKKLKVLVSLVLSLAVAVPMLAVNSFAAEEGGEDKKYVYNPTNNTNTDNFFTITASTSNGTANYGENKFTQRLKMGKDDTIKFDGTKSGRLVILCNINSNDGKGGFVFDDVDLKKQIDTEREENELYVYTVDVDKKEDNESHELKRDSGKEIIIYYMEFTEEEPIKTPSYQGFKVTVDENIFKENNVILNSLKAKFTSGDKEAKEEALELYESEENGKYTIITYVKTNLEKESEIKVEIIGNITRVIEEKEDGDEVTAEDAAEAETETVILATFEKLELKEEPIEATELTSQEATYPASQEGE